MRYKRINEATVQCIISEEDMEEYGLTISDIFERNEKGEGFLRDIVERAHDEIGYKISGENIAMQITPMRDEGLVVTFSDDGPAGFQHMLEHIKEMLTGINSELQASADESDLVNDDTDNAEIIQKESAQKETARKEIPQKGTAKNGTKKEDDMNEECRMFVFASMHSLLQYCSILPVRLSVQSRLYKMEGAYYLVLRKQRVSYKNFNRISAQAVEFGTLAAISDEKLFYLEEHGECLIEEKAVGKLRKIGLS